MIDVQQASRQCVIVAHSVQIQGFGHGPSISRVRLKMWCAWVKHDIKAPWRNWSVFYIRLVWKYCFHHSMQVGHDNATLLKYGRCSPSLNHYNTAYSYRMCQLLSFFNGMTSNRAVNSGFPWWNYCQAKLNAFHEQRETLLIKHSWWNGTVCMTR